MSSIWNWLNGRKTTAGAVVLVPSALVGVLQALGIVTEAEASALREALGQLAEAWQYVESAGGLLMTVGVIHKAAKALRDAPAVRSLLGLGAAVLMLTGCAVGYASPSGSAYGVAMGQAEVQACARDAAETEIVCSHIRGGAISPEGAKAIGPVQGLLQLVLGLL
jgi:hypothetical protein